MHENSVLRIVGYVMSRFANGAAPVSPWSLHLNFNKAHRSFELRPEHFTPDGENVTQHLIKQIESIDPGWQVRGGEPVFIEAASKKNIPISSKMDFSSSEALMSALVPKQKTFFSVMDEVFGGGSA